MLDDGCRNAILQPSENVVWRLTSSETAPDKGDASASLFLFRLSSLKFARIEMDPAFHGCEIRSTVYRSEQATAKYNAHKRIFTKYTPSRMFGCWRLSHVRSHSPQ